MVLLRKLEGFLIPTFYVTPCTKTSNYFQWLPTTLEQLSLNPWVCQLRYSDFWLIQSILHLHFPPIFYGPDELNHRPHAFPPLWDSSHCPFCVDFIHSTHIYGELTVPSAMSWDAFSSPSQTQIYQALFAQFNSQLIHDSTRINLARFNLELISFSYIFSEHLGHSAFVSITWVKYHLPYMFESSV